MRTSSRVPTDQPHHVACCCVESRGHKDTSRRPCGAQPLVDTGRPLRRWRAARVRDARGRRRERRDERGPASVARDSWHSTRHRQPRHTAESGQPRTQLEARHPRSRQSTRANTRLDGDIWRRATCAALVVVQDKWCARGAEADRAEHSQLCLPKRPIYFAADSAEAGALAAAFFA